MPALPEQLSNSAAALLKDLGVRVCASSKVAEVATNGVKLASGEFIPAELVVWAAGVKAMLLKDLDGLETNRLNQLVVITLQTTRDENIFVIGDCAACAWNGSRARTFRPGPGGTPASDPCLQAGQRRLAGQPLAPWHYRDFGSLVSLGEYSTVGNLMGGLMGGASGSRACSRG